MTNTNRDRDPLLKIADLEALPAGWTLVAAVERTNKWRIPHVVTWEVRSNGSTLGRISHGTFSAARRRGLCA